MKISTLAGAAWLLALLLAGTAPAQDAGRPNSPGLAPVPEPTGGEYLVTGDQPSSTPATSPAKPKTPASGDQPAATTPNGGAEAAATEEKKDEEEEKEPEAWKLFKGPWLAAHRIDIRGWVDQGFTWNPDDPTIRFNGPVAYNDRTNEYMMNQLYLITERVAKPEECQWDWGGRVDLLYGTDRRFPTAFGLDDRWSESERFYGLAMPQLYGDLAYGKWLFRAGHMLAPCGYENVMAPENFFYSHSYSFLYGQPTTITAATATWNLNDRFSLNSGIDTGWNAFDSINGKIGWVGGLNWKSKNEKTTVALEIFVNNEHPTGSGLNSDRQHYCLVLTHKFSEKITWAMETNYGFEPDAAATADPTVSGVGAPDSQWIGVTNYLFYQINPCWSAGLRYEWFKDRNGTKVVGLDSSHGIFLNNGPLPVPVEWTELSVGLNYKPNNNVIARSELRWDGSSLLVPALDRPFDDYTKGHQFLWANDLIVRF